MKPDYHYHLHNSPSLAQIPCQVNSVHAVPYYFFFYF